MALKDFLDEAKSKLGGKGLDENSISKNIVEKLSSVLDESQDIASEKIFALIEDFNQSLPILSKAGYVLEELELELGIPPKLIPHFKYEETKDSDAESCEMNEKMVDRIQQLLDESNNAGQPAFDLRLSIR